MDGLGEGLEGLFYLAWGLCRLIAWLWRAYGRVLNRRVLAAVLLGCAVLAAHGVVILSAPHGSLVLGSLAIAGATTFGLASGIALRAKIHCSASPQLISDVKGCGAAPDS